MMWDPHGRDTVRERADRALAPVVLSLCVFLIFLTVFVAFVDDE
jgi:hypothetical protein